MLILLTNDDGIRAPGIVAAYRALRTIAEVIVVAPETHQSASGHGVTLSTPLLTQSLRVENTFEGIAVDGRPADCVKLAINQLMPRTPDLVVSGINAGANVGINVVYSGTVAAAIEAAFLGLPSVALSLLLDDRPPDFAHAADVCVRVVRDELRRGIPPGRCVNVNLPALRDGKPPAGVRRCRQCTEPWVDQYERRNDPRGRAYFWNSSVFKLGPTQDDTDVAAVRDGYVAITPLQFDLTDHRALAE